MGKWNNWMLQSPCQQTDIQEKNKACCSTCLWKAATLLFFVQNVKLLTIIQKPTFNKITWMFPPIWQCLSMESVSNLFLCSSCSLGQHTEPGSLLHWLYEADTTRRTLPHCWVFLWCLCSLWNVLPTARPTKCFPCTQQSVPLWWVSFLCGSIHSGKRHKENLLSGDHRVSGLTF